MRPLQDADKNGWTVADFCIIMVVVDLPQQISQRLIYRYQPSYVRPTLFNDESRFQRCPGDHRRRVWRRPGQRADPAFTIARHARPQPRIMVWGAIYFDNRTLWSSLEAHLKANEDKARPHVTHVAMNCLTACQTLPWLARSLVLSSIEHVWDMMGRQLHLQGNVDTLPDD
ncbi:transposable element Tc1 transposase [Trichonephila clavipes]|nr:transposable element Tc1 transposase [Trichonephila clavipes]